MQHPRRPDTPTGQPTTVRARFPAVTASVPAIRWLVAWETTLLDERLVDDAELCASELATAVLRTGCSGLEVLLEHVPHGLRLVVAATGPGAPADPCGLGRDLTLLRLVASASGTAGTAAGLRAWAELTALTRPQHAGVA